MPAAVVRAVGSSRPDVDRAAFTLVPLHHSSRRAGRRRRRPDRQRTTAHADPSVAEIERQIDADWNKLEPIIERHNATRADLAVKRRQADALAAGSPAGASGRRRDGQGQRPGRPRVQG
ncbi:hypothetical protein NKG94_35525 [Micromonospora sp. M12]